MVDSVTQVAEEAKAQRNNRTLVVTGETILLGEALICVAAAAGYVPVHYLAVSGFSNSCSRIWSSRPCFARPMLWQSLGAILFKTPCIPCSLCGLLCCAVHQITGRGYGFRVALCPGTPAVV